MSASETSKGESDVVRVTITDGIASVILNRPRVLNALNHEVRVRLTEAFHALGTDDSVRAVVMEGEGRAFSSGQDQKESAGMDANSAKRRINAYSALYAAIRKLDKPIVAKIRGYAAGAGLQVALLADLRIVASSAKIGMTELQVGSVAILGSALLRNLAGEAVMKRLVLMSDFIPAVEAKSLNLVHEVVADDELDRRVADIASGLASRSPVAMALTKRWWRTMSEDVFQRVTEEAHRAHAENFASGGMRAGAQQFIAKNRA